MGDQNDTSEPKGLTQADKSMLQGQIQTRKLLICKIILPKSPYWTHLYLIQQPRLNISHSNVLVDVLPVL